jgi:hypothetical protein
MMPEKLGVERRGIGDRESSRAGFRNSVYSFGRDAPGSGCLRLGRAVLGVGLPIARSASPATGCYRPRRDVLSGHRRLPAG